MDITSHFSRRRLLTNQLGTYDLTLCRWKSINAGPSRKKEISNLPAHGSLHAGSIIKDTIYALVGPEEQPSEQQVTFS